MLFFSSDLHFGNDEALLVDDRPFKNAKQYEKKIIKLWNKQIQKEDKIWIIGDFADYHPEQQCFWERALSLVKKIKAKVNLVIGNNEERLIKYCFNNSFEDFKDYCLNLGFNKVEKNYIVNISEQPFFLTHKPKHHHKDMLSLFGHSHRAMGIYKSFGFNIGCDLNHFRLFSEQDIDMFLQLKSIYWDDDQNLKLI